MRGCFDAFSDDAKTGDPKSMPTSTRTTTRRPAWKTSMTTSTCSMDGTHTAGFLPSRNTEANGTSALGGHRPDSRRKTVIYFHRGVALRNLERRFPGTAHAHWHGPAYSHRTRRSPPPPWTFRARCPLQCGPIRSDAGLARTVVCARKYARARWRQWLYIKAILDGLDPFQPISHHHRTQRTPGNRRIEVLKNSPASTRRMPSANLGNPSAWYARPGVLSGKPFSSFHQAPPFNVLIHSSSD